MFWNRKSDGDDEPLVPYSMGRCGDCAAATKRPFVTGDVVFAESAARCAACGGPVMIEKIFGQAGR